MKKFIIILISLVVGFISGITFFVETMQIDIVSETDTGVVIRIDAVGQWFNYFIEKGE